MITNQLKCLSGPVLITGHTGFKGTWLTMLLESLGIEIVGLSLPATKDSLYTRLDRQGVCREEFVDVRNYEEIREVIRRYKPSAIFHLAAQPLVIQSYDSPRETFEINTLGTVNILAAAFEVEQVQSVAIVTTDKVYKNLETGRKFAEDDPLGGKDPYSASKVGAESAVTAWRQVAALHGGPSVIALRAGNVIGGGDFSENRLIPDLVRGAILGSTVKIRNPSSTRPWQHVLDPLRGYISAMEYALTGGSEPSFNFGPTEQSISVREVIEIFSNNIGSKLSIQLEGSTWNKNSEMGVLDLDSTLAAQLLGWQPTFNQSEAVKATAHWWKNVISDPRSVNQAVQEDLEQVNCKRKS